jgi:hypothetical protein
LPFNIPIIKAEDLSGAIFVTLSQQVTIFVAGRAAGPVCDACIADHLALTRRQANAAINRSNRDHHLRRFDGQCSGCCTRRRVSVLG